jgi:hypothetical protein
MMSSNATLEAASCRTAPVGGDQLPAACSVFPVALGFGPCSRQRLDHAPPARTFAQPYGGLLREASLPKLFPYEDEAGSGGTLPNTA